MLISMVEQIKALPPLPESFQKINAICSDENGTTQMLAKVIEKDPMLVASLLRLANSPLYGFSREIKSVLQAVSLFGMTTTRALVTGISVKKLLQMDTAPYGVTPEAFVETSNLQGMLMRQWYKKLDMPRQDLLFLCGLLQETGKILIAQQIVRSDEVTPFKAQVATAHNLSEVERAFVGTTTALVTAAVFEHWGFDETMIQFIRYSDTPNNAPDLETKRFAASLHVAKTAVAINGPMNEQNITLALREVQRFELDEMAFAEAIEQLIEHVSY